MRVAVDVSSERPTEVSIEQKAVRGTFTVEHIVGMSAFGIEDFPAVLSPIRWAGDVTFTISGGSIAPAKVFRRYRFRSGHIDLHAWLKTACHRWLAGCRELSRETARTQDGAGIRGAPLPESKLLPWPLRYPPGALPRRRVYCLKSRRSRRVSFPGVETRQLPWLCPQAHSSSACGFAFRGTVRSGDRRRVEEGHLPSPFVTRRSGGRGGVAQPGRVELGRLLLLAFAACRQS